MECMNFESVYKEYYQMIYMFVKKRVINKEVAEDLTGEIFEKIYTSFGKYDAAKCSIQTWLFVITNNHLKNYYRDRKEYIAFDESVETEACGDISLEMVVELKERQTVLYETMKLLSERDRNIIIYRYFLDMNAAEIGRKMNLSAGNVRISLKRALEKLKNMLISGGEGHFPQRLCKYCQSPVRSFGRGSGYYRCTSPDCPFRKKYGDTIPMEDCDIIIK